MAQPQEIRFQLAPSQEKGNTTARWRAPSPFPSSAESSFSFSSDAESAETFDSVLSDPDVHRGRSLHRFSSRAPSPHPRSGRVHFKVDFDDEPEKPSDDPYRPLPRSRAPSPHPCSGRVSVPVNFDDDPRRPSDDPDRSPPRWRAPSPYPRAKMNCIKSILRRWWFNRSSTSKTNSLPSRDSLPSLASSTGSFVKVRGRHITVGGNVMREHWFHAGRNQSWQSSTESR